MHRYGTTPKNSITPTNRKPDSSYRCTSQTLRSQVTLAIRTEQGGKRSKHEPNQSGQSKQNRTFHFKTLTKLTAQDAQGQRTLAGCARLVAMQYHAVELPLCQCNWIKMLNCSKDYNILFFFFYMSAQKAKGHEAVPRKNDISMLCLVICTVLLNKLFCHLSVLTRLACVHITSCQTYRPGFQHRKCQLTLLRCQYKAVQLV